MKVVAYRALWATAPVFQILGVPTPFRLLARFFGAGTLYWAWGSPRLSYFPAEGLAEMKALTGQIFNS